MNSYKNFEKSYAGEFNKHKHALLAFSTSRYDVAIFNKLLHKLLDNPNHKRLIKIYKTYKRLGCTG